jgi:Malectin domain
MISCKLKKNHDNIDHIRASDRLLHTMRVFLMLLLQLLLSITLIINESTAQSVPSSFHIRINGGGPLIVDRNNNNTRWESDTTYNVGNKGNRRNICTSQPNIPMMNIPLNVPPSLYCTQRFYASNVFNAPPYQYNIPVPESNAYYLVKLHFFEMVRLQWLVLRIRLLQNKYEDLQHHFYIHFNICYHSLKLGIQYYQVPYNGFLY